MTRTCGPASVQPGSIDRPFIVLAETKPSKRHIPVWARYSPLSDSRHCVSAQHTFICKHIQTRAHTYTFAHVHSRTRKHFFRRSHTCTHVHTHAHTYIHVHTHALMGCLLQCVMSRLIHTGLGSSSLIAHVLHSPPPPPRTAL